MSSDIDQSPEDIQALLLKEYCPPLDSALVLAISLEFESLTAARTVLDPLRAETIIDEADAVEGVSERAYSDWGNPFSDQDTSTTHTSKSDSGNAAGIDKNDEIYPLVSMFPEAKLYALRYTLEKCGGDIDRAIDELLNQAFLENDEEGSGAAKGIDGFSEDVIVSGKKRKGKKRGKNLFPAAGATTVWEEIESSSHAGGKSKWDQVESEVTYLSIKLDIPKATVSSAYHKYGSLSASLLPLIEAHGEGNIAPEDAAYIETISGIAEKYPRVPFHIVVGLVKLCRDDIAVAYKFADILNRRQANKIFIENQRPTISPVLQENVSSKQTTKPASDWITVSRGGNTRTSSSSSSSSLLSPLSPTSPTEPLSYRKATFAANSYTTARTTAFEQAHAAYRKSKSDPLMGAVATYYAEIGHSHSAQIKAYTDIAAEALVSGNSTEYNLDLHGVTVQQALKITNEKVTAWWVGVKSNDGKAVTPLNIVTGLGTHSKGGEGRIGPAVVKMLVKGGWKIAVGQGHVQVLGVLKQPMGAKT